MTALPWSDAGGNFHRREDGHMCCRRRRFREGGEVRRRRAPGGEAALRCCKAQQPAQLGTHVARDGDAAAGLVPSRNRDSDAKLQPARRHSGPLRRVSRQRRPAALLPPAIRGLVICRKLCPKTPLKSVLATRNQSSAYKRGVQAPRRATAADGRLARRVRPLAEDGRLGIGAALPRRRGGVRAQDANLKELGMCDCAHRDCLQRSQAAGERPYTLRTIVRLSSRWQGHTVYVATIRRRARGSTRRWATGVSARTARRIPTLQRSCRRARTRRSCAPAGFGATRRRAFAAGGRRQPPLRPADRRVVWRACAPAAAAARPRRRCRRRVLGERGAAEVTSTTSSTTSRAPTVRRCSAHARRQLGGVPIEALPTLAFMGALAGRNSRSVAHERGARLGGRRLLPESRAVEPVEQHGQPTTRCTAVSRPRVASRACRREGAQGLIGKQLYACAYPHSRSSI